MSSFLCSILCGADAVIDTGDGAGMNLLNIQDWDWDTDLLEATAPELIKRLPKVTQGSTTAGKISDYFIQKYGFASDTPITILRLKMFKIEERLYPEKYSKYSKYSIKLKLKAKYQYQE